MRWLLFQRVSDTEWEPAYGPLSQFAHGAVIYVIVLGLPTALVYHSIRQMRAGKKEYSGVLWWAVLMWPCWLLIAIMQMSFVAGSLTSYFVCALVGIVLIPWFIYGVWHVVPLLLRRRKRSQC